VTLEGIFSISAGLLQRCALSVAAEASQVLPTGEKHITRFRTLESNPVSVCYYVII